MRGGNRHLEGIPRLGLGNQTLPQQPFGKATCLNDQWQEPEPTCHGKGFGLSWVGAGFQFILGG